MGTRKSTKPKHIHTLRKSGPVWRCIGGKEDCSFFVYFRQEYVLIGRIFHCNYCGHQFKVDEEALSEDMPRCFACRHPVRDKWDDIDVDKIDFNNQR